MLALMTDPAPNPPDRRGSLRTEAQLPFAWCLAEDNWTPDHLAGTFGFPAIATDTWAQLAHDVEEDLMNVEDPPVRRVLTGLNAKLDELRALVLGLLPAPASPTRVTLGAEGIGFATTQGGEPAAGTTPTIGARIGCLLLLPGEPPLLEFARITRCDPGGWVGARLEKPAGAGGRQLTRYLMRNQ